MSNITLKVQKPFFSQKFGRLWSRLPVSYQGVIVIAIPAACLFITLGAWVWSRNSENVAYQEINQTEQVIRQSNSLLKFLIDAETGIRGYGITRNFQFLEPYEQAQTQLSASLSLLEKLTQDNPQQQQRLEEIERLIQQEMSLLAQTLEAIAEETTVPPSLQLSNLLVQGKATMDEIRASVDVLIARSGIYWSYVANILIE